MKKLVGISLVLIAVVSMAFTFSPEKEQQKTELKNEVEGIQFKDLTYAEALKISQQTGKPIFIDCYTVWCGPCKMLSNSTFKNKEVGEFFNANFINIKVEMEKDAEGPELARLFKVRAYPTLIFVNGSGEVLKESLGFVNAEQLIAIAKPVIEK